jgi:hypothetical protein
MGLSEIRHQVAKLCSRLLFGTVERVPESAADDWEKSVNGDRLLRAAGEVHEPAAPFASMQQRADVAGNKSLSASEVARRLLGSNPTVTISNVLVFGTMGSTPLKRMEIRLGDPKEVPATLELLALALQRSGVDFRAVRNPAIPPTEIWLTSPLHDVKKTLLSCAAMVGAQVAQVAAKAGSSRNHAQ